MIDEMKCPNCGDPDIKTRVVIGNNYRVFHCRHCRFTWVSRSDLANASLRPDYNNYFYNRTIGNFFEKYKKRYIAGMMKRLEKCSIRDFGGASFLDVGCANGEYLATAKSIGFGYVAGVEIDTEAVQNASKIAEVKNRNADLSIKLYDVIQIKNVISNIVDFHAFLSEYMRLLRQNGVLFIDTLNQDSITGIGRNILNRNFVKTGRYGPLRPPYVVNGFNKKSFNYLLRHIGLRIDFYATSYVGNNLFPYFNSPVATYVGMIGSLFGRGSMIIANCIKTVP